MSSSSYKNLTKRVLLGLFLLSFLLGGAPFANVSGALSASYKHLKGFILLQVEENGEAWYVYPENERRYGLGRPSQAFDIMRNLSLGVKHDFLESNQHFPDRLAGRILLDVEEHGEAYYIYPADLKKYYLGRPADAFHVMRDLSLGITNQDLASIPIGNLGNKQEQPQTARVIISGVPFSAQAPFADWQDQRQQDGCEEASALMAVKWAKNEALTQEQALDQILGSSEYTQEKYGEYRDISTQDALSWIIKDYLGYSGARYEHNIQLQDIISEIDQGNLVITPMDGQIMNNPYFTPPGPSRHMVLIRGYDSKDRKIITNDPGTRHGELYEYDYDIFYNAIRDYPTGYHEPIEKIEKNMIVIEK